MKLFFNKEDNNEVTVKIQQGTVPIEFTYTEMVRQLLENNSIDDNDFGNLNDGEKDSLKEMLSKILTIFEKEEEQIEEEEQEVDDHTDNDGDLPF